MIALAAGFFSSPAPSSYAASIFPAPSFLPASARLPATSSLRPIYPKRDRQSTTSLNGTWAFKLVKGLATPDELNGWNEPGFDTRDWDDIAVPGDWAAQGFAIPQGANQIDELSGFYVRNFRWDGRWEGRRVILRFDGVLFGCEVWLNGKPVGRWGGACNLAQWDVTDKLSKGRNTIAVKVMTRSRGWLFDLDDRPATAGIFRDVELFTVPNDYIEDIVFTTDEIIGTKDAKTVKDVQVSVVVDVGVFDRAARKARKVYVSLVDENGVHALDFERRIQGGFATMTGVVEGAHLWCAENPYLYTLVVTLADGEGRMLERIAEPQGLRTVRLAGRHLEINGRRTFLNGVAWREADPMLGRALPESELRRQMTLMKKAGVNAIRTAHSPFGPHFLRLCDEMGFYVLDEINIGSPTAKSLDDDACADEILARTEATIRRDKNHASVIFWTFGDDGACTANIQAALECAGDKDPTRPRGLTQSGADLAAETLRNTECDVDFLAPQFIAPEKFVEFQNNTTKPLVMTAIPATRGDGLCDFVDIYARMKANQDVWIGGFLSQWMEQPVIRTGARETVAADGIVCGDGAPNDAYWLVKALYAGMLPEAKPPTDAPSEIKRVYGEFSEHDAKEFLLRIRLSHEFDPSSQTTPGRASSACDDLIIQPKLLGFAKKGGAAVYRLRWQIGDNVARFFEGDVAVAIEPDGKVKVSYDLTPSEECANHMRFAELGLALRDASIASDRIDWVGRGPLTGAPGNSKFNVIGTWAMHKDDARFPGKRSDVNWAAVGGNRGNDVLVLLSGTGSVSFDNIDGHICISENFTLAPSHSPLSQSPLSHSTHPLSTAQVKFKGVFSFYIASAPVKRSDTAPLPH